MARPNKLAVMTFSALMLLSCAARGTKPLVDPFPLGFPLAEAGSFDIDGRVVGQPWARDGIVYYADGAGFLTAVVARSRGILWRRPVEARDRSGAEPVEPSPAAGPLLRVEGSKLRAFDQANRPLWEFAASGAIAAAPAVRDGRVFFGSADRMFFCLKAGTGKKIWSRRLQGAALHPAVVGETALAVAASNSVVYRLSVGGGSILSWEAVPSRIVHPPAAAGTLALVTSAGPTLVALDLRTGKRAGQYEAPGTLVAGAVWAPPYVVLFLEDEAAGRQKIVFLRSR